MAAVRGAFLLVTTILLAAAQWGCSVPENRLPLYQRSMVIQDRETEERVLAMASVEEVSAPGAASVPLLQLRGTPYEMGFQHGRLLKLQIRHLYTRLIGMVTLMAEEEMLDELYDVMAPYIPLEEKEEMRGLAHGADVPLRAVHWVHAIPELSEYGPKKRFYKDFEQTSCSNVVAFGKATADGELYQLRVLDWIRNFGIQQWPAILVHHPEKGNASVSFTYAGFIGTISGMNEKRLVFGEMGYGDPEGERIDGIPFIFLFRKLMREADSLEQVEAEIRNARRTNSYVYLVSDAKKPPGTVNALLFITDRDRVESYAENTPLVDEREGEERKTYPAIDDVVYGGAKGQALHDALLQSYGRIGPEVLKAMTEPVSLKSNLQNVIFRPATFEVWVSNASLESGKEGKASRQPWIHIDFSQALGAEGLAETSRD